MLLSKEGAKYPLNKMNTTKPDVRIQLLLIHVADNDEQVQNRIAIVYQISLSAKYLRFTKPQT